MKDVKYRLMDAHLYDYPYIQQLLTDQAAAGWHLEKVGGMLWKFRRGQPKQVRYEVTYAPKASAFNARPTEAEEDLADLCAQAGWIRVASVAQLQVFRNEDPNATPLETDEGQRLDTIRRTLKKHFFPQYALMVVLFLMQFAMHFSTVLRYPSRTLSSPIMVCTLTMLLLVSLTYLVLIADSILWLRRARNAVEEGQPIPANSFYRRFRWVIWAGVAFYLCSLLFLAGLNFAGAILGISAITLFGTWGGISLCKKLDAPKWVTMIVPALITAILMMYLLTLFAIGMDHITLNEELPRAETLPLTLTELTGETDTERLVLEETASPLASYGRYHDDAQELRLSYTIVDVHWGLFYDMCLNEKEQQFMRSASWLTGSVITNQGDLWDAHYARHAGSENRDRWFICWDDRIVVLSASWPLTEEQIAIAAETLHP